MTASRALRVSAAIVLVATLLAVLASGPKPAQAAFPGANGAIAFTSAQDGDLDIYRMAPDGFGGAYSANLTNNIGDADNLPAWNAEGTRIAFVSTREDSQGTIDNEIYVMEASGDDETPLTQSFSDDDTSPAWFPTDTKLAFVSNRQDAQSTTDSDIYTLILDYSGAFPSPVGSPHQITTSNFGDIQPAVSPDGKLIAFASNRDGDYEIYVMKAKPESATNKPVRLTNNSVSDTNPDWSSDGKRIVFDSVRAGSPTEHEIVVMNSDGSGQKLLTNNTFNDIDPAFSPDGRRIAFESTRANPRDIYRMRADGTNLFNLTNSSSTDANAFWQPN